MLTLLLSLALTTPASGANAYDGLYACVTDFRPAIVWVGPNERGTDSWMTYELLHVDDYPMGTQVRKGAGGSYNTRGGTFNSGSSGLDFADGVALYSRQPCEAVASVRDMLGVWGLDPAEMAQEVMDLEGWTRDQADARLGDADFALAAFGPGTTFTRLTTLTDVVTGATLPEPPPPPNDAPATAPEAADAYEGIYANHRYVFLLRGGRYVQFAQEHNPDAVRRAQYVVHAAPGDPGVYSYGVVDGAFTSDDDSDLAFTRQDGQVTEMVWRGQTLRRVYTLRQMLDAARFGESGVGHLRDELVERGLTEADVEAALDDAGRFADVVRSENVPITFGKLAGLE